jgi:hypothetical protein
MSEARKENDYPDADDYDVMEEKEEEDKEEKEEEKEEEENKTIMTMIATSPCMKQPNTPWHAVGPNAYPAPHSYSMTGYSMNWHELSFQLPVQYSWMQSSSPLTSLGSPSPH